MCLPLDVVVSGPETAPDPYGEYVSQLKNRLSNTFQDVREQLKTAQLRQKEYFNGGVKARLCQPGDQVFLFNPQLKSGEAAKFHRKWKGPYEVLERTTEVNQRIKKAKDCACRSKVVHFNNVKLYQRKCQETGGNQRNCSQEQGGLEKEGENENELHGGHGISSRGDLDEDEGDMDEFTDLSLPLPEPIMTTPDRDIQDPA